MTDVVYFFDGSSGCDLCDSHTGYYLAPIPRPHPTCNCPIEELAADDDDLDLRNFQYSKTSDVIETEFEVDNCDSDAPSDFPMQFDEDEDDMLDGDLREFAEAHGWSPPDSGDLDLVISVSEHAQATVTVQVERYSAWLEAEVWKTLPNGTEAQVSERFGSYSKNIRIVSGAADVVACEDRANRVDPGDLGPGDVIT